MAEGGIVPPPWVLAPGPAQGLLRSRALPSAQLRGIVVAKKGLSSWTQQRGVLRKQTWARLFDRSCPGVGLGQLEIPPVWGNSRRTVEAAAWASNGRGQQHVAVEGVALTVRNSQQIRPHLPPSVTGQSCSR